MRPRNRHGLTFLELVLALLIVFLASSYLIGLFLTSTHHFQTAKEYATATFLAQSKMEGLLDAPVDAILTGQGSFDGVFDRYLYDVEVADYDSKSTVLTVEVTSPRGARATMVTMKEGQMPPFLGVASDALGSIVPYSRGSDDKLCIWNEVIGALDETTPAQPGGGMSAGLGSDQFGQEIWVVDKVNRGIRRLLRDPTGTAWSDPPLFPGGGFGRPTGVAADHTSVVVWVADANTRLLWRYFNDPANPLDNDPARWTSFPIPSSGQPTGVACEENGLLVWVGDYYNQCLRLFDSVGNTWSGPFQTAGMGKIMGVACDRYGQLVFSVDSDRLYLYDHEKDTWSRWDLPQDLKDAGPSGAAVDQSGQQVFVATRSGDLWKFTVAGSFARQYDAP